MDFLTHLWLPILLSAVFVFVVSSIFHMALPLHKGDARKLTNEDAVLSALRGGTLVPGAYMFPCPGSMKDMNTPEMTAKFKQGPVGWLTIMPPGGFNIGKNLVFWFLFCLLVGLFVAYVGWYSLGPGAAYRTVLRITGTAALLGYAMGHFQESIWKGQLWSITAKFLFDGVVYGLVTGFTFAWLWPAA